MLYLIGLGLDKKDISLKALEVIKKCKNIYIENYTTKLPYSIKELEKTIKKKITELPREEVENNDIVKQARRRDIALLIYGNPLVATTHYSLISEAKKQKIKIEVIHAPSILDAAAETGLHIYKFGKIASLPKWDAKQGYKPVSFFDVIKDNLKISAHTLLLIDKNMSIKEALSELAEVSGNEINDVIICSRLGTKSRKIIKGKLSELCRKNLKIKEPFCIIIPASLHFTEAEALGK